MRRHRNMCHIPMNCIVPLGFQHFVTELSCSTYNYIPSVRYLVMGWALKVWTGSGLEPFTECRALGLDRPWNFTKYCSWKISNFPALPQMSESKPAQVWALLQAWVWTHHYRYLCCPKGTAAAWLDEKKIEKHNTYCTYIFLWTYCTFTTRYIPRNCII